MAAHKQGVLRRFPGLVLGGNIDIPFVVWTWILYLVSHMRCKLVTFFITLVKQREIHSLSNKPNTSTSQPTD
jgi:hypothetical protein